MVIGTEILYFAPLEIVKKQFQSAYGGGGKTRKPLAFRRGIIKIKNPPTTLNTVKAIGGSTNLTCPAGSNNYTILIY